MDEDNKPRISKSGFDYDEPVPVKVEENNKKKKTKKNVFIATISVAVVLVVALVVLLSIFLGTGKSDGGGNNGVGNGSGDAGILASGITEDGYKWELMSSTNTVKITGYVGSEKYAVIPFRIEGHVVTHIGDSAFEGCNNLEFITSNIFIQSIGDRAFAGCSNLEELIILLCLPADFDLGENFNSDDYDMYDFYNDFYNGYSLSESILDVEMESLSIGSEAFLNCANLKRIELQTNSIANIGKWAFKGCPQAIIYSWIASQPEGWDEDWNPDDRPVDWHESGRGRRIFGHNFEGLEWVSMPKTNTVKILQYFGTETEFEIPSVIHSYRVTHITSYAFSYNTDVSKVVIPSSITYVDKHVFAGCNNLTIYCEAQSQPEGWDEDWNSGNRPVVWSAGVERKDGEAGETESGLTWYLNPDSNTVMITGYLGDSSSVVIPDTINGYTVTKIGDCVFESHTYITDVIMPNSITDIGYHAFTGCSNLESVNISESLTHMEEYAFAGCSKLERIYIPISMERGGYRAFVGCDNLTIYCEAQSQPEGWNEEWNKDNRPVVWSADIVSDVYAEYGKNGKYERT